MCRLRRSEPSRRRATSSFATRPESRLRHCRRRSIISPHECASADVAFPAASSRAFHRARIRQRSRAVCARNIRYARRDSDCRIASRIRIRHRLRRRRCAAVRYRQVGGRRHGPRSWRCGSRRHRHRRDRRFFDRPLLCRRRSAATGVRLPAVSRVRHRQAGAHTTGRCCAQKRHRRHGRRSARGGVHALRVRDRRAASGQRLMAGIELTRIEEAGLNALQTQRQLFYDGWLLRVSPGTAKRARSVNPYFGSTLSLDVKIDHCERVYGGYDLPTLFRITPFIHPSHLERTLDERGYVVFQPTYVQLVALEHPPDAPPATAIELATPPMDAFVNEVAALRGSSEQQRAAHLERLSSTTLATRAIVARLNGSTIACGQAARERDLVVTYDDGSDV